MKERHTTYTMLLPHGLSVGNTVKTSDMTLKALLTRPRILVISECTETSFTVSERRMSWGELFSAIWERIAR